MHLRTEAIVLSVRAHGEHGAVVRALTAEHGVQPGYVRGGASRRLRPALQPANTILGDWRSRIDTQLASLTLELVHSLAPLHLEPLPAAALDWVTALTAAALPEATPYPRLHSTLEGLIAAIEAAPMARDWGLSLARYEWLVLAELGYGLERERLPDTMRTGGSASWHDILDALALTGAAIEADLLTERRGDPLMARARLIDRLKRAVA